MFVMGLMAGESPQPAISLDQLYGGFAGKWVGPLEWRDFSDNSRVCRRIWVRSWQNSPANNMAR